MFFINLIPATAAAAAAPTPKEADIIFPTPPEDVVGSLDTSLSILITSNSSPLLSTIFVSLSGAEGVVVDIFSASVTGLEMIDDSLFP